MLGIVREWSVYFVLLCAASVPPVWTAVATAGEPLEPDPVVQAEEVVVSATKTPLPVTQVTSAVEVITAQDMKRQNIRSVVDALRLAQGVAVFSNGGPGTEVTAKIRGGSANQTLVLIDGAIVMRDRQLASLDHKQILADAKLANRDLLERVSGLAF